MELLNNIDEILIAWGMNPQTAGWADQFIAFALVLVLAFAADFICRKVLLRAIARLVQKTKATWDDILFDRRVMVYLSHMVAPVVIYLLLPVAFAQTDSVTLNFIRRRCFIYIIFSWTFYTVFDQQMFPQFFTQFFATKALGQQMYGVLNSVEVFLEAIMMACVPWLMKKIGVRKTLLVGITIMVVRIGGCGLVTNPLGVSCIKLLHAPETACFALGLFRYFTLHFDTKVSATLYMVGYQIAAQVGQIIFSTPLGDLRDHIGYSHTFLVISGITLIAGIYATFILKKDNVDVNGQPLN